MKEFQAEFEKWYLAENPLYTIDKTPSDLNTDEIYCKPATRRAWAAWKAGAHYVGNTAGDIRTVIHLLRDSVRHPDNDKLMQDAATMLSRIPKAIGELQSQIDGGEECKGRDSQISHVIHILEGTAV